MKIKQKHPLDTVVRIFALDGDEQHQILLSYKEVWPFKVRPVDCRELAMVVWNVARRISKRKGPVSVRFSKETTTWTLHVANQ